MSADSVPSARGVIAWMARNSVAANLLMMVIIVGGLLAVMQVKQEVFPAFDQDLVNVTVAYPGASPSEVEQGIVLAVEEAVRGIDGVKRITSVAAEGVGTVNVELLVTADRQKALADVKNAVDRIQSFPEDAEKPTAAMASPRLSVISLIIAGDQDLRTLHNLAELARAELLAKPEITQVELFGVRPLEIAVEVSRENLEAYGFTLEGIALQIRAASVELPGGGIDTRGGEVLVRVADRRRRGVDFENIILRGTAQGHEVRLGDVATVTDGYEDTDQESFYNGQPAVRITVYRVGDETPTEVAQAVRTYADQLSARLPDNITLATWNDSSEYLSDRISLLVRNAAWGLVLVLIILTLLLQRRVAGWVALGIPVSFFGAFLLMGPMDASINMMTLFALIVTLGMVVDDAIVVAENVHVKLAQGIDRLTAAIEGAREMVVPVTFAILTTMVAFAPLLFVPGAIGKVFRLVPLMVVAVLFFSLVESFFVLPAHLGHGSEKSWRFFARWDQFQKGVSAWLEQFIERRYRPVLEHLLRWRYVTVASAVALLMVVLSAVASGLVPFSFFPSLEGDVVVASARLPYGAPIEATREVGAALERAAQEVIEANGGDEIFRGMFVRVGEGPTSLGLRSQEASRGSHIVSAEVNLVPSTDRDITALTFADQWRDRVPVIPGLQALTVSATIGPSAGQAVDIQLTHPQTEVLAEASSVVEKALRGYSALTNIDNSYAPGKQQLNFTLLPDARVLGLTSSIVARELRASFFGAEALREQRGRNEIKVRVRLPEDQRSSEDDVEQLLVGTPLGGYVPLVYVAEVERGRAPTAITREDGHRTVNVSGDLAQGVKSPRQVLQSLRFEVLPAVRAQFSGLETRFVGQERERAESFASLGPRFLVALLVIFALLAIPFRSYAQPLIIMSAIPFGAVGAVFGHVIMGYELSIISILGMIALSGVVVNDSLVLVHAVNRYRLQGTSAMQAVIQGGVRRFRPILLTSLTTFFGLMPITLETSPQAKFLIPMAISLGFGALFVTAIVLLIVPALYLVVEDLRNWTAGG